MGSSGFHQYRESGRRPSAMNDPVPTLPWPLSYSGGIMVQDNVLVATGVTYYHDNDETAFFDWLDRMECVENYRGEGRDFFCPPSGGRRDTTFLNCQRSSFAMTSTWLNFVALRPKLTGCGCATPESIGISECSTTAANHPTETFRRSAGRHCSDRRQGGRRCVGSRRGGRRPRMSIETPSPKIGDRHDRASRQLRLRPAAAALPGRARARLDVSLPGLPAPHRQRVQHRRLLRARSGECRPGRFEDVHPPLGLAPNAPMSIGGATLRPLVEYEGTADRRGGPVLGLERRASRFAADTERASGPSAPRTTQTPVVLLSTGAGASRS